MSSPKSSLKDLATSFISGFTTLNTPAMLAIRAESCIQMFAPASRNPPAPKTNADFAKHINNSLRPVIQRFPLTAKEIHINEAGRQITIWTSGKPEFRKEAMGDAPEEEWDYTGEYVFIMDVHEEGKIVRILEFLDSLATTKLRDLMERARENVGLAGRTW
jgi:hypothetical protein